MEAEGIFPDSMRQDKNNKTPKPEKDIIRKENYRPILLMKMKVKILNIILQNESKKV